MRRYTTADLVTTALLALCGLALMLVAVARYGDAVDTGDVTDTLALLALLLAGAALALIGGAVAVDQLAHRRRRRRHNRRGGPRRQHAPGPHGQIPKEDLPS
jgi:hypothetical protein